MRAHRCVLAGLIGLVILPGNIRAADNAQDTAVLTGQADQPSPRKMLRTYLVAQAQRLFDERARAIAALKTPADISSRRDDLRAKFIAAVGGEFEHSPLNPLVVGTQQYDGYRIERVIYQSRPDYRVTANFYIPDGPGPFPGVLLPCGHTSNGKAGYQAPAILLAKNGIACLCYDPPEQGERWQLFDADGKPLLSHGTTAHSMMGTSALLVGQSMAQYWIQDAIRGVDYLVSRPEIDPKRIGCTGSSGGGMMTAYLMALDDRVFAAAPSCYITSLPRLFATIGPQDAEQNVPGQIAFGMDHGDYLLLHSPRPAILLCASRDFFDISGTWSTFREAKNIYGALGFAERMNIAEFDTQHGFPRPQREQMARFMRHWLLQKDDAVVEKEPAIVKDAELQCTKSGQVMLDFKGACIPDFIGHREAELAAARADAGQKRNIETLRAEVRKAIALPESIPPAKKSEAGVIQREGYEIQKLKFETEPGIVVPGLAFVPAHADENLPLILSVNGRGMDGDAAIGGPLEALAKSGRRVLAFDLRGFDETAPGTASSEKPDYLGVDFTEAYMAIDIGRPLIGQRVYDLLSVIRSLAPRQSAGFELIGSGAAGPAALHAAVLDSRITRLMLSHSLVAWSLVARAKVSTNQLTNAVPGVLKSYDLPDLAASLAPRSLSIEAAVDEMGHSAGGDVLNREYSAVRAGYAAQNAAGRFVMQVPAQERPAP